ncbi:uncharacterized protein LOC142982192 isoform X2 [Anticarsia gemmatalis]|uniref:uncharacterized protein LOC142982192 isoform X2 n=1 Tax=Anticarsia gemmatalis TaxID=129554 RepID=UPI003F759C4B
MRTCFGLALAILITATAYGDRHVPVNEGESLHMSIMTLGQTSVISCVLEGPNEREMVFAPGDESSSTDKFVIQQGPSSALCDVLVKNVDKDDEGTWTLSSFAQEGTSRQETFLVTVNGLKATTIDASTEGTTTEGTTTEETTTESDDLDYDEDNIILLNTIQHFTRQDVTIDISLPKKDSEEDCYIRPPNGRMTIADELQIAGVEVRSKSNFVSCRITIGPMSDSLLGSWRLCGKSEANDEIRCQPVDIAWHAGTGLSMWPSVTNLRVNYPVHYGGFVNPGVQGSGTVVSCHVITPAGEDLVITTDTKYPHIEYITTPSNPALCSIYFNVHNEDMIGDWIIYGKYHSFMGHSENRIPLTFFLFDKENPYNQAYNVTVLDNQQHLVRLGTELSVKVGQSSGAVVDCDYEGPSGQTFSLNSSPSKTPAGVSVKSLTSEVACQIAFTSITDDFVGKWQIIAKFQNGVRFDERHQTFTIIKEDPANPIDDEVERAIQLFPERLINTAMGTTHSITISSNVFTETDSCHLITPDGLQYAFIDGFDVPGVTIIKGSNTDCGVTVQLIDYSTIGNWTLIARGTRLSEPLERRQPFTIRVEDNFVLQNDIDIAEGSDLYLHLRISIEDPETCILYGPDGNEYVNAEVDTRQSLSCGYIIRSVESSHNGRWVIEYGKHIKHRGSVTVNVLDPITISLKNINWRAGDSIDISLGPENAVYCKIEDPHKKTVFDDFGQCKIVLDLVTVDHSGRWKMFVGVPGAVRLQEHDFSVDVIQIDAKPIVTTTVERNAPSVMLTCSVPNFHEVNACKFRDPRGNIFVAAHGVGQDGYMFNGSVVNYESEAETYDCSLRLINPTVQDLGMWRCAMSTSTGTYYGFLTVVCPHLMQDPEVAASVVTEPVLEADRRVFSFEEDEAVTMSCSIPTQLRYCYFRARNGTVYNVFPSMRSEDFEYVGAGLDAGDCGIRFRSLSTSESGLWSCHAGFIDTKTDEQRANFDVDVRSRMLVHHYWHWSHPMLIVEAVVYEPDTIDYCRFVRIDGQGFTSDNLPPGYELEPSLHKGHCVLYIRDPTILDLHPWTIAVQISGMNGEISKTTTNNLLTVPMRTNIYGEILFWLLIVIICMIPLMAASALIPKKNREWTYRRASRVRTSFRNSWNNTFHKKPAPVPQTEGV